MDREQKAAIGTQQSAKTTAPAALRVKIATFNINDVNKRLDNLAWLEKAEPDVVCLQELKADHGGFPERALRKLGYEVR